MGIAPTKGRAKAAWAARQQLPGWNFAPLQASHLQPQDMILTVETGLSLRQAKLLAEAAGLWLPLDGPSIDLPLGQWLAGDLSASWLCGSWGTARDHIVAMTVLNDNGQEVRSGAAVVKNVAGHNLAPLYVGGHHAFGPILQLSFRLLPMPSLAFHLAPTDSSDPCIVARIRWPDGEGALVHRAAASGAGPPPLMEQVCPLPPGPWCLSAPLAQENMFNDELRDAPFGWLALPGSGTVLVEGGEPAAAFVEKHGGRCWPLGKVPPPKSALHGDDRHFLQQIKTGLDPQGHYPPLPHWL